MKKPVYFIVFALLGIAIAYQVYAYYDSDSKVASSSKAPLPELMVTSYDSLSLDVQKLAEGKYLVMFLVRSDCGFCKQQIAQVNQYIDEFENTEVVFISFEDFDKIRQIKAKHLPEDRDYIRLASGKKEDFAPILNEDLVYPYMLWYDENNKELGQYRGVFPVTKILEVVEARKAS